MTWEVRRKVIITLYHYTVFENSMVCKTSESQQGSDHAQGLHLPVLPHKLEMKQIRMANPKVRIFQKTGSIFSGFRNVLIHNPLVKFN